MTQVLTANGPTSKLGGNVDGTPPMFRSYTEPKSCPTTCPLMGKGCYAELGPTNWVWRKVATNKKSTDWQGFCQKVKRLPKGTMWRHNVAGDLPNYTGTIDKIAVRALVQANTGKNGFTYTHHALTETNLLTLWESNDNGFTINISANGMHQVDQYIDTGLPVVTVLPIDAPKVQYTARGRKVVVCPAVSSPDKVTCSTCGICADTNRSYAIGFPAHGVSKKKAQTVALGE